MKNPQRVARIIVIGLVSAWAGITALKFGVLGYRLDQIVPQQAYDLTIATQAQGHGEDLVIGHYLPLSELGQSIDQEKISGDFTSYHIERENGNRRIEYDFTQSFGELRTSMIVRARTNRVRYRLPGSYRVPEHTSHHLSLYLKETDLIQTNDSAIVRTYNELGLDDETDAVSSIKTVFGYVYEEIRPARFSGETDAALTCRLGEASCNGKSRLMVALLRRRGIPSRLVGGIILRGKTKRTGHQWVEVYLNGSWVPFCPLNGYFAEKPAHYMSFYRGDHAMLSHTSRIRFDYHYSIAKKLVPRSENLGGHGVFDIVNVWQTFASAGIPVSLLSVVLVIPIGALVTIIFRNVIGLQTFGTFLPALVSYSFFGTGLWWGMAIFAGIIMAGALVNRMLGALRLLHTPRLTIIMVFVVGALIALGTAGARFGNSHFAQAFFFPLAILSITIERFFTIAQERGMRKSIEILGWTMLVVAFCYMVMSSVFLQMVMVVLPETFLLVVAAALYFGHWTGIRVSELIRFRTLIFDKQPAVAAGVDHA